jgi:hypothetical protein
MTKTPRRLLIGCAIAIYVLGLFGPLVFKDGTLLKICLLLREFPLGFSDVNPSGT